MINKVLFWIFLLVGVVILGLNFSRKILEVDLLKGNILINKLLDYVRSLPIVIQILIVLIYAVILILLYRGFSRHIDSIK